MNNGDCGVSALTRRCMACHLQREIGQVKILSVSALL